MQVLFCYCKLVKLKILFVFYFQTNLKTQVLTWNDELDEFTVQSSVTIKKIPLELLTYCYYSKYWNKVAPAGTTAFFCVCVNWRLHSLTWENVKEIHFVCNVDACDGAILIQLNNSGLFNLFSQV